MKDFYSQFPAYQLETECETTLNIFPDTLISDDEIISTHTVTITDGFTESDIAFVVPFVVVGETTKWEVHLETDHRMIVPDYKEVLNQVVANLPEGSLIV